MWVKMVGLSTTKKSEKKYQINHNKVIIHSAQPNPIEYNIDITVCITLCKRLCEALARFPFKELFFAVLVLFLVLSYNLYPKINHPFIIRIMMLYN